MVQLKQTFLYFLDALKDIGIDALLMAIIFLVAKLIINIVSKITGNTMKKADVMDDKVKSKKIKTSMTVTHSLNRYLIYIFAIFLCLRVIGLGDKVSNAIVAAGIGGLIISFGAQSIVKDMLSGLFLLFERQFFVGDYVKINDYEGTVLSIALRVTYLDCGGKKVIIPNGDIRDVVNYSHTNSIAIITIPTPYEKDTRKVMNIIQGVIDKYYEDHSELLTENKAKVPGIDSFDNNGVNITIRVETKTLKHWEVKRDLMLLIKEEFKKNKIEIPHSQTIQIKD